MSREAYVGVAACGCIRAAHVIDPKGAKDTADFARDILRDGRLRLEIRSCAAVRAAPWGCPTCEPKRYQTTLDLSPPAPSTQPDTERRQG